ncbi:hypothetical protein LP420_30145 [Massilia sp. B-10]|nr:hypothetical protein LP420_30145 [Massilia sp. B-10]
MPVAAPSLARSVCCLPSRSKIMLSFYRAALEGARAVQIADGNGVLAAGAADQHVGAFRTVPLAQHARNALHCRWRGLRCNIGGLDFA